jgi:hypothetical protein
MFICSVTQLFSCSALHSALQSFSCSVVLLFRSSAVQLLCCSVFQFFSCLVVQLFSATAAKARNEMLTLFVQIGPLNLSCTDPPYFASLLLATLLTETHTCFHYTFVCMLALLLQHSINTQSIYLLCSSPPIFHRYLHTIHLNPPFSLHNQPTTFSPSESPHYAVPHHCSLNETYTKNLEMHTLRYNTLTLRAIHYKVQNDTNTFIAKPQACALH